MLPSVTSPPQRPTGRQSEKMYDVSVHILARSVSPSVRTATTTDTNWFPCHAAGVTQTTWAQTGSLPLPQVAARHPGSRACMHSWCCHDVRCLLGEKRASLSGAVEPASLTARSGGGKTTTSLNQILLVGASPESRLSGTLQGILKCYQLQLQPPYPLSAWKNNN